MMDKVEQVRQRRKAEKSLLSLQRRLATTSAEELENSGCQKTYASPGKSGEASFANASMMDMQKEAKIEKMKYEHLTREAALTENELLEEEYKKKLDEANKELSLENDLAGM
ncbi:hypothetical protein ZEAMMB73_Zm00001d025071 [Zea mays]|uniref:Uncharacterized protein n=1 Tax=Zea mays TaxID=4577 RepID=A0A1D6J4L2_MAIZE|nr:hypothetical protein ZEAMMB73_Zm00001d025071 [Zea mays]